MEHPAFFIDCLSEKAQLRTPLRLSAAYVPLQCLREIFPFQRALQNGTLFPELFMPLAKIKEENAKNDERFCLRALAFARLDLRLYLNSHPHDRRALKMYELLSEAGQERPCCFEQLTKVLEGTKDIDNGCCCPFAFEPVLTPWPWEENE